MMQLAARLKLTVPKVYRHYCPEPVYIVERFDRITVGDMPTNANMTTRLQLIDTCQLLNKSRGFKYTAATLETLVDVIDHVRVKGPARLALFRWLVFNLLIGNNDNHIKNISYMIDQEGVKLAPFYDLLSTATYLTKGYAVGEGTWPQVDLAIALPGRPRFADVTFEGLLEAGAMLGLNTQICTREIGTMAARVGPELDAVIQEIEKDNQTLPDNCRAHLGGELRLLRTIRHVVVDYMVGKLAIGVRT